MYCAGNVEAARWVLKSASELKILNSEQIMSLTASLAEDCSGRIQNGQICHKCSQFTIFAVF